MCLDDFLLSILSSIIASLIFLISVFFLLRPRLDIGQGIAKSGGLYYFKVCNRSLFRAYDIKIELFEVKNIQMGGNHLQLENIEIKKSVSAPPSLAKFDIPSRIKKPQNHIRYEFALQFKTDANIDEILNNSQKFLRVQIEARHGLTGLQSIFVQDFDNNSVISNGSFVSGKFFEIR